MSKDEIKLDSKAVGKLQEVVGGGTEVIANPELTGDEPDLEGLEVDGAKYKVPSGSGNADHITLVNGATEVTEEQIEFLLNNKGAYILYGDTPYYNVQWNGASLGYVTQLNCRNNGESFYVNVLLISAKNLSITQETYTIATTVAGE